MHSFVRVCGVVSLAALGSVSAFADQQTLTEYSSGNGSQSRVRLYQKQPLQRTEMNDRQAMITRPEAMIFLDLENKTFTRTAMGNQGPSATQADTPESPAVQTEVRKGGIVKTRSVIEDTGERKQIFGYEARHLKMRTEIMAAPDSCNPGEMRMETDGWYIDLKEKPKGTADGGASGAHPVNGGCKDEHQSEFSGSGKPGFPIEYVMRLWQNGQGPHVTSMKVIEFSEAELSASLFEVPEGFTDGRTAKTATTGSAAAPAQVQGTGSAGAGIPIGVAPVDNADSGAQTRLVAHLAAETVGSIPLTEGTLDAARKAGVTYLLKSEQVANEPKKRGGMFGKLSQAMGGRQAELRYTLIAVSDGRELLRSSAVSKAGGSGFGAALAIAQTAAPVAGGSHGGHVAQAAVQTAVSVSNQSYAGLPVGTLFGYHSYAAYSGMMDPNLQSLAYMGRYSPSMAAAQAGGMVANAAFSGAGQPRVVPAADEGAEGTIDNAMRLAARAVRDRLNR